MDYAYLFAVHIGPEGLSCFMSLMLAVVMSYMTEEVLSPATGMVSWVVLFYLILGIWIGYYRTPVAELYDMCETEYEGYDQLQQGESDFQVEATMVQGEDL